MKPVIVDNAIVAARTVAAAARTLSARDPVRRGPGPDDVVSEITPDHQQLPSIDDRTTIVDQSVEPEHLDRGRRRDADVRPGRRRGLRRRRRRRRAMTRHLDRHRCGRRRRRRLGGQHRHRWQLQRDGHRQRRVGPDSPTRRSAAADDSPPTPSRRVRPRLPAMPWRRRSTAATDATEAATRCAASSRPSSSLPICWPTDLTATDTTYETDAAASAVAAEEPLSKSRRKTSDGRARDGFEQHAAASPAEARSRPHRRRTVARPASAGADAGGSAAPGDGNSNTAPVLVKLTPPFSVRMSQLFWILSFAVGGVLRSSTCSSSARSSCRSSPMSPGASPRGARARPTRGRRHHLLVVFGMMVAVLLVQITLLVSFMSRRPHIRWWQLADAGVQVILLLLSAGDGRDRRAGAAAAAIFLRRSSDSSLLALLASVLPQAIAWSARQHDVRRGRDDVVGAATSTSARRGLTRSARGCGSRRDTLRRPRDR